LEVPVELLQIGSGKTEQSTLQTACRGFSSQSSQSSGRVSQIVLWRRAMASAGALFPTGVAPIMAMQLSTAIKPKLKVRMIERLGRILYSRAEKRKLGRCEDEIDPLLGDGPT